MVQTVQDNADEVRHPQLYRKKTVAEEDKIKQMLLKTYSMDII